MNSMNEKASDHAIIFATETHQSNLLKTDCTETELSNAIVSSAEETTRQKEEDAENQKNEISFQNDEKRPKSKNLMKHLRVQTSKYQTIHTGEKPVRCYVYKHSFNQKSNLAIHMRTHTSEKPFKCEICKHSFNKKNALIIHLRTHTGEKPFKCDVCKHNFNQKGNLAIHMRAHTGEKPFKCAVCKHSFNQK
ncbi:oocyte zinc finger protein XlCOF28-like, partial [Artemia franciscana]|uniref:oocyte zinc finger protein XlCOF28-like n=1 Tax=Artemia franciscana TaxID=6661 RepID=UPI0032DB7081